MNVTFSTSLVLAGIVTTLFGCAGQPPAKHVVIRLPETAEYDKERLRFKIAPAEAFRIAYPKVAEDLNGKLKLEPTLLLNSWYLFAEREKYGQPIAGVFVNGNTGERKQIQSDHVLNPPNLRHLRAGESVQLRIGARDPLYTLFEQ